METFRKIALVIIIVASSAFSYKIFTQKPCDRPLTYHIGTVDAGFGIDSERFQAAVTEAESLWEKAIGKDLFAYDPAGTVSINLIYDARQSATDKSKVLKSDINVVKVSAGVVKRELDTVKARYETARAEYEASRERPESLRLEVNSLADQASALVEKYNALVKDINANVDTVNGLSTDEFEQGHYSSSEAGQSIDVYQFEDHAKLVRVLAHEFGHALGLGHSDDPSSVMYYINQAETTRLSDADVESLKVACGIL
jgi:predicted Zn-dependent protease